jgi:glucose/arabinose dehydrogenase
MKNFFLIMTQIFIALSCSTQQITTSEVSEYGSSPHLAEPAKQIIPKAKLPKMIGWKENEKPKAIDNLTVQAYGTHLKNPRWLYVLPNGDVLVAESSAPSAHDETSTVKDRIRSKVQKKKYGSSADQITLLRGVGASGQAQLQTLFLENLNSPFGMALIGNTLYVANTDSIVMFHYKEGQTKISDPPKKFIDLPGGEINHHWTKNLIASPDGKKLYVSVGSNSNAGENGIDAEKNRACILVVDIQSKSSRVYASGLRNPVGMDFEPTTGELWTSVNERDELGDDLVPDYMTSVHEGDFFGFPFSYYGQHVDSRVKPQNPELVKSARVPDYALGSHTASLGLTFSKNQTLSDHFSQGAFIGQHGSWNRSQLVGYKVIFVPFQKGKPAGNPKNVVTGFLNDNGEAHGRPVGVAIDKQGALLVADDAGNTVWRVSKASH